MMVFFFLISGFFRCLFFTVIAVSYYFVATRAPVAHRRSVLALILRKEKKQSISFPLPISLDLSRAGLYSRVMSYDWRRNVVYARVVNDS